MGKSVSCRQATRKITYLSAGKIHWKLPAYGIECLLQREQKYSVLSVTAPTNVDHNSQRNLLSSNYYVTNYDCYYRLQETTPLNSQSHILSSTQRTTRHNRRENNIESLQNSNAYYLWRILNDKHCLHVYLISYCFCTISTKWSWVILEMFFICLLSHVSLWSRYVKAYVTNNMHYYVWLSENKILLHRVVCTAKPLKQVAPY